MCGIIVIVIITVVVIIIIIIIIKVLECRVIIKGIVMCGDTDLQYICSNTLVWLSDSKCSKSMLKSPRSVIFLFSQGSLSKIDWRKVSN